MAVSFGTTSNVAQPSNAGPGTYPKCNFSAAVAPGVNDDDTAGYVPGSQWVDTTGGASYICQSNATGAAVWLQTA